MKDALKRFTPFSAFILMLAGFAAGLVLSEPSFIRWLIKAVIVVLLVVLFCRVLRNES
jgi:hypothetical protein